MKIFFVPLLACTICAVPAVAQAVAEAAVALCRGPIAEAPHSILLPQSGGAALSLVVATSRTLPKDAGCRSVPTGLPADAISWLGAVSASELDHDSRIALTVREADEKILAVEVDRPQPSPATRQLVPRAEVLPVGNYRIFGGEERVMAQPDVTTFDIACRPGQRPAGAILDLGAAPPGAALALELQVQASEGFQAQIVGHNQEAKSRGTEIPSGAQVLTLPVPREGDVALVITCPEVEGRLRLEKGTVRPASARPLNRSSAWVWEPDVWRQYSAELLAAATRLGLGRLYVTVPIAKHQVVGPDALASFLAAAHGTSIDVVAVEGDPDMISNEGRANALERARALAAYNKGAAPQERLDGVQYDIEPYLGAGYAARSDVVWQLWAETLLQLSTALGQQIDVVVPCWILESGAASGALEQLMPALNRLTIMAYRTDPSAIVSAAAPLLAWSSSRGLAAAVALESVALARERRKVYVKAPEGDLHVIRFDDVAAVVVLDRVRTGSTDRAYRLSHTVPSDSARVSFNGDTRAAFAAAAEVAPDLAAWPSAHGFAFHGLTEVTANAVAGSRGSR